MVFEDDDGTAPQLLDTSFGDDAHSLANFKNPIIRQQVERTCIIAESNEKCFIGLIGRSHNSRHAHLTSDIAQSDSTPICTTWPNS